MRTRLWPIVIVALVLLPLPGQAQEPERPPASERQLREAIREHFEAGLRRSLSLADEQMAEILPRVERIEESKRETARLREGTVRELYRGMQQGVDDMRLQELLDQLESADLEQQQLELSLLHEIDEHLSVRQRVQLRFFIQRFRGELRRRVEGLQGDRRGRGGPRRGPRERP